MHISGFNGASSGKVVKELLTNKIQLSLSLHFIPAAEVMNICFFSYLDDKICTNAKKIVQ